jgi:flagellar basal-body rod protein FlgF
MIQGLYAAATGMMSVQARQETIANNIANASTTGYRRHQPVALGFYQHFASAMRRPAHFSIRSAPGGGVKVVETFADSAAGALRTTDDPMKMALQGPGFFVVNTSQGERFTRAGNFSIGLQGNLVTSEGHEVMGMNGQTIDVAGGVLNVAEDGSVTVYGTPAGQLLIIEFQNPERLLREGDNLYRATDEVLQQSANAADTVVLHKKIELSIVQISGELTRMMLGLRAYEANQRVIQALDSTMSRLIDQVGMPA